MMPLERGRHQRPTIPPQTCSSRDTDKKKPRIPGLS
jgi:hypothetical protein